MHTQRQKCKYINLRGNPFLIKLNKNNLIYSKKKKCPDGYTGNHCQFKTGCNSKPCKKGVCENLKENATLFHCNYLKIYTSHHLLY